MLFLLTGITGHVGGAAARNLLQHGHSVRAIVRDSAKAQSWADQGVELVQAAWEDTAALAGAMKGVDGVYLMMPPIQAPSPDFREARTVLASYKQALTEARPPKLVLLSSFGSEQTEGLGLITSTALMEQELTHLDIPAAILRPGGFYENYLPGLDYVRQSGTLPSFYQPVDRPLLMVATEDIGNEVARLLTAAWNGNRIFELGTVISPVDIAAGMTEAFGKQITAVAVPRERWTATLESVGFPKGTTSAFEEMVDGINSGHIHHDVQGTEPLPGVITPAQFFSRLQQ